MNFWVLIYLISAPFVGVLFFLWFNREALKRRWWFYRHPQTVYKAVFYHPNKMFSETYVHSVKETFEFNDKTYNIKKEAILRKNWFGISGNRDIELNKENCSTFEEYKLLHNDKILVVPNNAQMIGELHYVFDFPDPLIYADAETLINQISKSENLIIPLRTAGEQNRVEKNSVLDQLITAEFKKMTLMIIIIILVFVALLCAYQLALRLELIKTPLHAVCVNIGEQIAK